MFVILYKCVFLGLIFSFSAFGQIIEFITKLLIFNLLTTLFRYGSVIKVLIVETQDSSADKVLSLKKTCKYFPSSLQWAFLY
jgi:hypothetical protein